MPAVTVYQFIGNFGLGLHSIRDQFERDPQYVIGAPQAAPRNFLGKNFLLARCPGYTNNKGDVIAVYKPIEIPESDASKIDNKLSEADLHTRIPA